MTGAGEPRAQVVAAFRAGGCISTAPPLAVSMPASAPPQRSTAALSVLGDSSRDEALDRDDGLVDVSAGMREKREHPPHCRCASAREKCEDGRASHVTADGQPPDRRGVVAPKFRRHALCIEPPPPHAAIHSPTPLCRRVGACARRRRLRWARGGVDGSDAGPSAIRFAGLVRRVRRSRGGVARRDEVDLRPRRHRLGEPGTRDLHRTSPRTSISTAAGIWSSTSESRRQRLHVRARSRRRAASRRSTARSRRASDCRRPGHLAGVLDAGSRLSGDAAGPTAARSTSWRTSAASRRSITAASHGPGYSGGSSISTAFTLPGGARFSDDFHVFAIDWASQSIAFSVDGTSIAPSRPAHCPRARRGCSTSRSSCSQCGGRRHVPRQSERDDAVSAGDDRRLRARQGCVVGGREVRGGRKWAEQPRWSSQDRINTRAHAQRTQPDAEG